MPPKSKKLMGVPPEQVADVMALMGDSIDNIPGAKGIGEKGARELIRRFGSVEAALEHAAEVENKRYREALINCREQVLLSKQLARISGDAPVELDLECPGASRTRLGSAARPLCRARLHFAPEGFACRDHHLARWPPIMPRSNLPPALREFLDRAARGSSHRRMAYPRFGARGDRRLWSSRRRIRDYPPAPGVARFAWCDPQGEMIAALREFLADPERPKIVHDPKLIELLDGPLRGTSHAVMLYSYLLRPTTAQHDLAESRAPPPESDSFRRSRRARRLPAAIRRAFAPRSRSPGIGPGLRTRSICLSLRFWRPWSGTEFASILPRSQRCPLRWKTRFVRSKRCIWELAGSEFNINSPPQLAEILFDKLNLGAFRQA